MPKATPRSFISYTYIYTIMIHSCRHIYGCTMDSTGQCRDVGMSLPVSSTSGIFASTGNLRIHIHLQIIHYVYQNVRVVWVSRYTKVHISVLSYHIHELWSIITPVFCWRNHPFITVLVDVPHMFYNVSTWRKALSLIISLLFLPYSSYCVSICCGYMFPVVFPSSSYIPYISLYMFPPCSHHVLPIMFASFALPIIYFPRFSDGKIIFPSFSHHFPIIFPRFSDVPPLHCWHFSSLLSPRSRLGCLGSGARSILEEAMTTWKVIGGSSLIVDY